MAGYGGARGRKKLTKKKKVIERFKNIHPPLIALTLNLIKDNNKR